MANVYNKNKIINDPVYGLITIQHSLVFDLICHPYFQRLRDIKQCALTYLVYPGATHTRFAHALGAMHLMNKALDVLKGKGCIISDNEAEAAAVAILLHDIGHCPFSHALEKGIIEGLEHENISNLIMHELNIEFEGKLNLAIEIFKNKYKREFFHQLVSGQIDLDRMDYLIRDSFFTGVSEGVIGFDRIIKMLNVVNDELVVEEKGIYSIEKFIIARRLMYWQVYFHKTVLSAEIMLINIMKRAKELAIKGVQLWTSPFFHDFLYNRINKDIFLLREKKYLHLFCKLSDHDIMACINVWAYSNDKILSLLCSSLINRDLFKVQINKNPIDEDTVNVSKQSIMQNLGINFNETGYLVVSNYICNKAYDTDKKQIKILKKDGNVVDIVEISDIFRIENLYTQVKKFYICKFQA